MKLTKFAAAAIFLLSTLACEGDYNCILDNPSKDVTGMICISRGLTNEDIVTLPEYTKLETLSFVRNQLTEIDLSPLLQLRIVDLGQNDLTTIDVSN